jgi:hypothetical protein
MTSAPETYRPTAAVAIAAPGQGQPALGLAGGLRVQRVTTDQWVVHASLNALAVSVILHVAVGRRWPFRAADTPRP